MRSTPEIRFAPILLRRFLIRFAAGDRVRGQSLSHDTKWFSEGNEDTFGPTSVRMICAAPVLMPSMRVRSTPANCQSVVRPCWVTARLDGPLLGRIWMARDLLVLTLGRLQRPKLLEQAFVVQSDHLAERVIQAYSRRQIEEVFLAPVAP